MLKLNTPHQAMFPGISAQWYFLWAKFQTPVLRQWERGILALRPRVTDPFHSFHSIPYVYFYVYIYAYQCPSYFLYAVPSSVFWYDTDLIITNALLQKH